MGSDRVVRTNRTARGIVTPARPGIVTVGSRDFASEAEVAAPKGGHLASIIDRISAITEDVVSVKSNAETIADSHLGSGAENTQQGFDPPSSNGSIDAIVSRLELLASIVQLLAHQVNRIGQL